MLNMVKRLMSFSNLLAYGPDSRPPMAIFELLDYIVNEVSAATVLLDPDMTNRPV